MNRELKFRAWCEGSHGNLLFAGPHMKQNVMIGESGGYVDHSPAESGETGYTIIKAEEYRTVPVMQYTGLSEHHRDGKEVYDCDIIRNVDTDQLQVVFWNEDQGAWYCRYVYDESRIVSLADSLGNLNEIKGNIYENPDLLK